MANTNSRHEKELFRLYDKAGALEPGTEQHTAVWNEIMKAREEENERNKTRSESEAARRDMYIKIATFSAGLILAPIIETVCKRELARFIGTVEQMEYFTSSAGKSISGWFRWK
jgi:hypothetical protein